MTDYSNVSKPTGEADDYEDIVEPTKWTVQVLIDKKATSFGRFDYDLHASGKTARISYVNYDKSGTKYQKHKTTNAFKLKDRVEKEVVIE